MDDKDNNIASEGYEVIKRKPDKDALVGPGRRPLEPKERKVCRTIIRASIEEKAIILAYIAQVKELYKLKRLTITQYFEGLMFSIKLEDLHPGLTDYRGKRDATWPLYLNDYAWERLEKKVAESNLSLNEYLIRVGLAGPNYGTWSSKCNDVKKRKNGKDKS